MPPYTLDLRLILLISIGLIAGGVAIAQLFPQIPGEYALLLLFLFPSRPDDRPRKDAPFKPVSERP